MNNIFKDMADTTAKWACKNAPTILTCVGAAGVIFTAIASGEAAIKAKEKLEELPEDVETKEKVKVVLPIMVKPAIIACGTMWAIFSANKIALRRNAALLAAYTLSSRRLEEYEDKVVETIGEGKNKKIKDAIAEDHVEKNPPTNDILEDEDTSKAICFDELNGRYFKIEPEKIDGVINKLNDRLIKDGFVCLNDFYEELNLPPVKNGENLGWKYEQKGDDLIELVPPWQLTSVLYQNKYPVRIISFMVDPVECLDD